eukprot:TRINITY_DN69069_c0_g1_i1.p1 TRINITY_DN69069_c0_g1~~TRINITY_DN69069_c0_g1_i1.p1  ORF type:complete len:616 (+),score=132.20 TRINITY_DN69069_c0_g1_i1:90-1850(+)
MENLPTAKDQKQERKALFRQADINGNGICSLAECDRLIVTVLNIRGVKIMKPVINRAFHAARDIAPPVGKISPHYVDWNEFRFFLIYLKYYLQLFILFDDIDLGRYSDRRMSYSEFEQAIPKILDWGVGMEVEYRLNDDPQSVFQEIDANGGGVVMFDEFAHWALWNHIFTEDEADDDMEDALEALRKQKPNLCGKDLSSIKASKAKYRVGAKIHGQGCLAGDPSLAGGYDDPEDGAAELVAGRHYPGGLAAWKSSFWGKADEQSPGMYRVVGNKCVVNSDANYKEGRKVGNLETGDEIEVVEVEAVESLGRMRGRIESPIPGWISLKNMRNGFLWVVKLQTPPSEAASALGTFASDQSLARVREAGENYKSLGLPECVNGCGNARFGKYQTCCTWCKGDDGPHAPDCCGKGGYELCENGCGHPQFGKYTTCCTHCTGADGPHHPRCAPAAQERAEAEKIGGQAKLGRQCENGCGRKPYKQYDTCCTYCTGEDGPHHHSCDKANEEQPSRNQIRKYFYRCQDLPMGMSYDSFKGAMASLRLGDEVDDFIQICDKDGNGVIDIDEFLEFLWSGELHPNDVKSVIRDG